MNTEDLLYEIYNENLYDEVMELVTQLRIEDDGYNHIEIKDQIDMAYQIVKKRKTEQEK
jgi:hypothetical protein